MAADEEGNPTGEGSDGIELTPGNYVLVCFIPEGTTDMNTKPAKNAQPHAALGMVQEFTVS